MNSQNSNYQIAIDLISQYGEDAESIAMLRAAEYAANLNTKEWLIWEGVIKEIQNINTSPNLQQKFDLKEQAGMANPLWLALGKILEENFNQLITMTVQFIKSSYLPPLKLFEIFIILKK